MQIGVPKEIKVHEYRVGLTPSSVRELTDKGHTVYVEHNAGAGIGFFDKHYEQAGAIIVPDAQTVFSKATMIVKVKEPQLNECAMLTENHLLFTYLHLAPDPQQTQALINSGCTAIAYETITDHKGALPLLAPMSAVAGRLSIQVGAQSLEKHHGGRGVLLGGVAGVSGATVVVIGGGVVGANAIRMAVGMEANVIVLDKSVACLEQLDKQFGSKLDTRFASQTNLEKSLQQADLVIGAVLVPGAAAPKIVKRQHLAQMKPGSVIVDVSIDQGGCVETSKITNHTDPTFVVDGVVHYCVANMPGAVPRTAAIALNNSTLPYVMELADKGLQALTDNPLFLEGLNVYKGKITCEAVSKALNNDYFSAKELLKL